MSYLFTSSNKKASQTPYIGVAELARGGRKCITIGLSSHKESIGLIRYNELPAFSFM